MLVVDDSEVDRAIIREIFKEKFEILEEESGLSAMVTLGEEKENVALLFMDIYMPEMNGIEVLEHMRGAHLVDDIPVILMTAEALADDVLSGIEFGMADFIAKPFKPSIVYKRVLNVLGEQEDEHALADFEKSVREDDEPRGLLRAEEETSVSLQQKIDMYSGVKLDVGDVDAFERQVFSLVKNAFRIRGFESTFHLQRVRMCTRVLMEELSRDVTNSYFFPEHLIEIISRSAVYHDIGKLALPDEVVRDKGEVWVNHRELYQSHTIMGREILRLNNNPQLELLIRLASNIALYHHERWDGGGYPYGLKGQEIPLAAQIVGLVQRYDHMVMNSWKSGVRYFEEVVHAIYMDSGAHNPILTGILPKCKERFIKIAARNGMILQ